MAGSLTPSREAVRQSGDRTGSSPGYGSATVDSFLMAESIPATHSNIPLTTLDALHLGVMRSSGITLLPKPDRVIAQAAEAMGLECRTFF